MSLSPIEGYLTRELEIRFIDARKLANEAKIALGITGYPSQEEHMLVRHQARIIFESLSPNEQEKWRQMNYTLTNIKSIQSQSSIVGSSDTDSITSHSTRKSGSSRGGRRWLKRTFLSLDA